MRRPLAAVSALIIAAVTAAVAPPASAAPDPLPYVAMGDSYSAATGVFPLAPDAPLVLCGQSARNYPHVIAERIGADLTDVSCGGATTSNFTGSQYPGVAPQLDALNKRTKLVTMTIGGNDNLTFASVILACGTAGIATLGNGSPCKDLYGSTFTDTIRQKTYPALKRTLRAVHRKAPNAQVAILGAPWIVPRKGGCFLNIPVGRGDLPYIRNVLRVFNDVTERAAKRTGSTYVDLSRASNGHDACKPPGTRWIEPMFPLAR
ncbi:SGNH/GDSL hydrolase family protein [Solicola gregarius]|uniref:SGNH/GDSL hydrolase family protein n=1 Tax=Solicola gregarius TaxID=2908642 RepID=A0AA46TJP3_9ACTN|nr:SGNH/GDSL hydrolase family protein [Solicola gregarius]UYM06520.1 SGNH/GDSL hydrolase family protein [Solicola gregarius]